jgi:hypothetical protein
LRCSETRIVNQIRAGLPVASEYLNPDHPPKETTMVITLGAELESALNEAASRRGVAPDVLALNALRERFLGTTSAVQPQDEWERQLLGLAKDCGVSLPDSAVRREALYE